MRKRERNFLIVWTVLGMLALLVPIDRFARSVGYQSSEALFADALFYTEVAGCIIVPVSIRSLVFRRRQVVRTGRCGALGRTTHCRGCKRKLIETNGSNCLFCGWIRCPRCGACGCSAGKHA